MKKILCFALMILSPLKSNASLSHEEPREEEIGSLRFVLPTQAPGTREIHELLKALDRLHITHINERSKPHETKSNLQLQDDSRRVKKFLPDPKR